MNGGFVDTGGVATEAMSLRSPDGILMETYCSVCLDPAKKTAKNKINK